MHWIWGGNQWGPMAVDRWHTGRAWRRTETPGGEPEVLLQAATSGRGHGHRAPTPDGDRGREVRRATLMVVPGDIPDAFAAYQHQGTKNVQIPRKKNPMGQKWYKESKSFWTKLIQILWDKNGPNPTGQKMTRNPWVKCAWILLLCFSLTLILSDSYWFVSKLKWRWRIKEWMCKKKITSKVCLLSR